MSVVSVWVVAGHGSASSGSSICGSGTGGWCVVHLSSFQAVRVVRSSKCAFEKLRLRNRPAIALVFVKTNALWGKFGLSSNRTVSMRHVFDWPRTTTIFNTWLRTDLQWCLAIYARIWFAFKRFCFGIVVTKHNPKDNWTLTISRVVTKDRKPDMFLMRALKPATRQVVTSPSANYRFLHIYYLFGQNFILDTQL